MPTAPRPNVIFILTDQQRFDSTGLHGNPLDLTPNLDRLALDNTHIANAFTPQPVCGPARMCLQTGMYQNHHGNWKNDAKPLAPDVPTIAREMAAGGYDTAYVGKWHLGPKESLGPVDPAYRGGYDFWMASNVLEMTSTDYHTVLYDNSGAAVFCPGYRVDAVMDAAIRYIGARVSPPPARSFHVTASTLEGPRPEQEKPFFLFLSLIEPHHQNHIDDYPPPVGYRQRYDGRWTPPDLQALGGTSARHLGGYWGMVRRIDEALGRLLDVLKSLHLEENTVIVFTSDHGSHFKTRNSEYKRSCHDASIRVPCVLAGGPFRGGGRIRQLVSLIDLPPTLLDAAGLRVPATMQGRSLLPLVRRTDTAWDDEVFVQISESQIGRAIRTRRWKYSVSAPGVSGGARCGADHYIEEFLYDLESDPYELDNLVNSEAHTRVREWLRGKLAGRMERAGEPRPAISPAAPSASGQRKVFDDELI